MNLPFSYLSTTISILFISQIIIPISSEAKSSLSLNAAIQQAIESNYSTQISHLDADIATSQATWGHAGFWPKIDLTGSQSKTLSDSRIEKFSTTDIDVKNGAENTTTLMGINGSWTVFEGLASFATKDRLNSQAAAASARRVQNRQDLVAQVILAYTDIIRQETVLAALDSSVALSEERKKITQGKYGFGSVSKLDLLQAKLDLNEDLSTQLKQKALVYNARNTLNRILARPENDTLVLEDSISLFPFSNPLPNPTTSSIAGKDETLELNPYLKQAALNQEIASAAYREYRGHLLPQLALNLGYNYSLAEAQTGLIKSNENIGWNYGLQVKWNLFEGWLLPTDYQNVKALRRRADLSFQDIKSQLFSALTQVKEIQIANWKALELESSNLSLASENVSIAMERMRIGTIASLELRAAQEKFIAAKTRWVTARYECKRSETEILRLTGKF